MSFIGKIRQKIQHALLKSEVKSECVVNIEPPTPIERGGGEESKRNKT